MIDQYLHFTKTVMPTLAATTHWHWAVRHDHCFQRIVLDNTFNGIWYDHLKGPAYKHLNNAQARKAVMLCKQIITGSLDLNALNMQSLKWRGKKTSLR